jgi:hypothetical protein
MKTKMKKKKKEEEKGFVVAKEMAETRKDETHPSIVNGQRDVSLDLLPLIPYDSKNVVLV